MVMDDTLTFFLFYVNMRFYFWDKAISNFDIDKLKINGMGNIKCQGHLVDPVSN